MKGIRGKHNIFYDLRLVLRDMINQNKEIRIEVIT